MRRTAAILAGGESSRLRDKALLLLAGKPMILHIIDKCKTIVDEILLVVNTKDQADAIEGAVGRSHETRIVRDRDERFLSPLLGARTAFESSGSELTLLLPCDAPLIKTSVLELFFRVIGDWDAVVPRHPSGHIEPLHALYKTNISLTVAAKAVSSNKRSMKDLITQLRTLYLSTDVIRQLDPRLETFTNINTPEQFERIRGTTS